MPHLHCAHQSDALFRGNWGRRIMSSLSEVVWPYTVGLYGKQFKDIIDYLSNTAPESSVVSLEHVVDAPTLRR